MSNRHGEVKSGQARPGHFLLPHRIRAQASLLHLNPAGILQTVRLALDLSAITEGGAILRQIRRGVVHAIQRRDGELDGVVALSEARDTGALRRILRRDERLAGRDVEAVERAVD